MHAVDLRVVPFGQELHSRPQGRDEYDVVELRLVDKAIDLLDLLELAGVEDLKEINRQLHPALISRQQGYQLPRVIAFVVRDQLVEQFPGLSVLEHAQIERSQIRISIVFAGTNISFQELVGVAIDRLYNGYCPDCVEVVHY